jgi:hypothetical protein
MNRTTRTLAASLVVGIASLSLAGVASAQPVNSLSGDWSANNSTVVKTTDGVHFGTYADGGALAGSLLYKGFNGKLRDVSNFDFTFNYKQSGDATAAVPYGRIWLDTNKNGKVDWTGNAATDDATVMFDPSRGGSVLLPTGADVTFGINDQSVRYDDDKGNSGQLTWDEVKAAHADEDVIMVGVSQGNAGGKDVSAMLKSIKLAGQSFDFNVAPADGSNGKDGVNGKDGANGSNGKDGVTTIIREHKIVGASMRKLAVPTMKNGKLVSVKATMRGKKLTVSGRKIKANLTGRSVGNYNVSIVAKFKKHGKIHTVRQTRSLSITLAA